MGKDLCGQDLDEGVWRILLCVCWGEDSDEEVCVCGGGYGWGGEDSDEGDALCGRRISVSADSLGPPGAVTSPSFRLLLHSAVGWVASIAQWINKRLVELGHSDEGWLWGDLKRVGGVTFKNKIHPSNSI